MAQNKVDWSTGSAAGLNLEQTHNAVWSSMEKHVDVIKPEDIELGVALGEGQFAMTYKATVLKDLRMIKKGQEVAVKRVKGFSPDAVYKEVLCLHTLSYGDSINFSTQEDTSLDAQYVVKLLGFNAEVVPYFIVMELVDGDTLHAEMEERGAALPLRMTLALTKDMLLGLQHAQCRNIVHRDIKSLNIMLCNQERKLQVSDSKEVYTQPDGGEYPMAKIVDWGECAAMSTNQDRTNEVGTLRWMAPEVMGMGGNCADYGAPVDLYSLSSIIYHMVTGTRPWEQLASNMQVAFAVQSGKRPSMEGVGFDKCPALLQFMVRMCFHEDPDRRPVVHEALSILESVKDRQGWEEGVPSRTSVTDPVYTFFLPPVPEESPTWQFLSNMTVQQYLDLREKQETGKVADGGVGMGEAPRRLPARGRRRSEMLPPTQTSTLAASIASGIAAAEAINTNGGTGIKASIKGFFRARRQSVNMGHASVCSQAVEEAEQEQKDPASMHGRAGSFSFERSVSLNGHPDFLKPRRSTLTKIFMPEGLTESQNKTLPVGGLTALSQGDSPEQIGGSVDGGSKRGGTLGKGTNSQKYLRFLNDMVQETLELQEELASDEEQ